MSPPREDSPPDKAPEFAQPECLASSRLDQHDAMAQADGAKDAHPEPDVNSDTTQGKSASCTADVSLRPELETLRESIPYTRQAIITFEKQSVQMFFSPENAIADFQRKVEELWNIPKRFYYLTVNGLHESKLPNLWQKITAVQVKIKGLLGGKPGNLTIWVGDEEIRCRTNQSMLEILDGRDIEIEGECLFTKEGTRIELDEKVGVHLTPGSETELSWNQGPNTEEEEFPEETYTGEEYPEDNFEEGDWDEDKREMEEDRLITLIHEGKKEEALPDEDDTICELPAFCFPGKCTTWIVLKSPTGNIYNRKATVKEILQKEGNKVTLHLVMQEANREKEDEEEDILQEEEVYLDNPKEEETHMQKEGQEEEDQEQEREVSLDPQEDFEWNPSWENQLEETQVNTAGEGKEESILSTHSEHKKDGISDEGGKCQGIPGSTEMAERRSQDDAGEFHKSRMDCQSHPSSHEVEERGRANISGGSGIYITIPIELLCGKREQRPENAGERCNQKMEHSEGIPGETRKLGFLPHILKEFPERQFGKLKMLDSVKQESLTGGSEGEIEGLKPESPHSADGLPRRDTDDTEGRNRRSDLRNKDEETENLESGRESTQDVTRPMSGCGRRKIPIDQNSRVTPIGGRDQEIGDQRSDNAIARLDPDTEKREKAAKHRSDLLDEIPESLSELTGREPEIPGRSGELGCSSAELAKLKEEVNKLRHLPTCKSANVYWEKQLIQVQFEESQAIKSLTRKIKDV
jgi:hypothetical protein